MKRGDFRWKKILFLVMCFLITSVLVDLIYLIYDVNLFEVCFGFHFDMLKWGTVMMLICAMFAIVIKSIIVGGKKLYGELMIWIFSLIVVMFFIYESLFEIGSE